MALDYLKMMEASPFKFLVGPERRVFYIHPTAISEVSTPLSVMMHGEMKEGVERCAELPDILPSTFAKFSEFLYTGSYTTFGFKVTSSPQNTLALPCPRIQNPSSIAKLLHSSSSVDQFKSGLSASSMSTTTTTTTIQQQGQSTSSPASTSVGANQGLFTGFNSGGDLTKNQSLLGNNPFDPQAPFTHAAASSALSGPQLRALSYFKSLYNRNRFFPSSYCSLFGSGPDPSKDDDYSEVFLLHARLWVFADQYNITRLELVSLDSLHWELYTYPLYGERVGDIVSLLRYVYENTIDQDLSNSQLRQIVISYVACFYEYFIMSAEFRLLLTEANNISMDLLDLLAKFKE